MAMTHTQRKTQIQRSVGTRFKRQSKHKRTDMRTIPTALPFRLTRSVIMNTQYYTHNQPDNICKNRCNSNSAGASVTLILHGGNIIQSINANVAARSIHQFAGTRE